jgi:hypothetical protein
MVRTFLKVYMELGSYFLFLQEQIKDIIIKTRERCVVLRGISCEKRYRMCVKSFFSGTTVGPVVC